jgi:chromosome segregation ATPase
MSEEKNKGAAGAAPDIDIKAIQDENTALKTEKAALESLISKLEKEAESNKSELEDAAKMITELKARLKDIKEGGSEKVTVEVDKKKYHVTVSMRTKDGILKPEDIAADKELCKKLIANGSGIIIPV